MLSEGIAGNIGIILLLGAAVLLYAAARAAVDALAGQAVLSPGRRAVGHWIPIALVALAATLMGRAEVAVGVIFGTSVASLALVSGIVAYFTPIRPAPGWRRVWPFVLPAALLALMAGFRGALHLMHALALMTLGVVVLAVWLERRRSGPAGADARTLHNPIGKWRHLELALAVLAAALGAWAAVQGTLHLREQVLVFSTGVIAATLLSPVLVLAMIGSSLSLTERGQGGLVVSTSVGLALLNLCGLLPAVIVLWHVMGYIAGAEHYPTPLIYPLGVWRIDTVVLIVLGLVLLPVAMGRWRLGRREGLALIAGYGLYILIVGSMGLSW